MERRELSFLCEGVSCAARLVLPEGARPFPAVVMAHGATGTMSLGLAAYADRFAEAGLAVLEFDYRRFGLSGGSPRQVISVHEQLDDWRCALRFARTLAEVDRSRLALWGTSLSAGHVLTLAAEDRDVRAVVAQLPWLGVDPRRPDPRPGETSARLLLASVRDTLRGVLGRSPEPVRVFGRPGETALFTGPGDEDVAQELTAHAEDWRNEVAARAVLRLLAYRPGRHARDLTVPLLVCVADEDVVTSPLLAARAAAAAPLGELRHYPGGHFQAYTGKVLDAMARDEAEFLTRHLGPVRHG